MRIVPVNTDNLPLFLDYCARHGSEFDPSYLPDESFQSGLEDPAFLLLHDDGVVAGAVALIISPSFRAARKARFRIFHASQGRAQDYGLLLEAVTSELRGIDSIYLFVHEEQADVRGILEELGFGVQRYAWHLERPSSGIPDPVWPAGFALRRLRPGTDDVVWCGLINANFTALQGHLDMTLDDVRRMRQEKEHLSCGTLILWNGEVPVGTVRLTIEPDGKGGDVAAVGALSVLAPFRLQGLGRNLLRATGSLARWLGHPRIALSVNAENLEAANLYLDEGFRKVEVLICYNLPISGTVTS